MMRACSFSSEAADSELASPATLAGEAIAPRAAGALGSGRDRAHRVRGGHLHCTLHLAKHFDLLGLSAGSTLGALFSVEDCLYSHGPRLSIYALGCHSMTHVRASERVH
jgi:hypothetical protein